MVSQQTGVTMVSYSYPNLKAFAIACTTLGLNACALLADGTYVYCADGWIIAREIAYAVA